MCDMTHIHVSLDCCGYVASEEQFLERALHSRKTKYLLIKGHGFQTALSSCLKIQKRDAMLDILTGCYFACMQV